MNTSRKKWLQVGALLAIVFAGCSGDDTTIGTPHVTEAKSEYAYEIVFNNKIDLNEQGYYTEPIPDNGTYPIDAINPHITGMTLRQIMDLGSGNQICLHDGLVHLDTGKVENLTAKVLGTGLLTYTDRITGVQFSFLGIHIVTFEEQWISAAKFGISPEPDGITWVTDDKHATLGLCPVT